MKSNIVLPFQVKDAAGRPIPASIRLAIPQPPHCLIVKEKGLQLWPNPFSEGGENLLFKMGIPALRRSVVILLNLPYFFLGKQKESVV